MSNKIPPQVQLWRSAARLRAFVGGVGSGKTFCGALEILKQPAGSKGIVVAPTYGMMRDASQSVFFEICPPQVIKSHNKAEQHTILKTGTEIFWRSADKPRSLRGPNLNWGWGDEWAYAGKAAHKIVLGRLRRAPGRFWVSTTPNGQNWFFDWVHRPELAVELIHAHTADNPYNLKSYAADLAAEYADDPAYAAQELAGEFADLSGSKRIPAAVMSRIYEERKRLTPRAFESIKIQVDGELKKYDLPIEMVRQYAAPARGLKYVIGCDPAEGLKSGDETAIVVCELVSGAAVAIVSGALEPQEHTGACIKILSSLYNKAPALIERNNHGHAVIASCRRHGVICLRGEDKRPGLVTSTPSKVALWNEVSHNLTATAAPLIFDPVLRKQVSGIERVTLKGAGKSKGLVKVDDQAVAFALAQGARARALKRRGRSSEGMRKLCGVQ